MRILQIRFKNLNSLTGEWLVDFTHPGYTSDGIFAIIGPTGAGKTTILDAICLALYGRTPRLNRVTKSSNEIMSRQTGECFAEVVFETPAGQFRCHWSQHRARRRPVGELQPPRHEVADADSGKVLQSRLRDTGTRIEAVTGMDFERFTRSMLLAQGGFAAFLQAPPDERAPILEQITGTEIYSLISIKVHQLRSGERKKLEMLEAELDGQRILSEGEQHELERSLKAANIAEKDLAGQVKCLKNALFWRESLSLLEKELAVLEKQQQDFEQRQKAFGPLRMQLARAGKALTLEGHAARTVALRSEQEKETIALDTAQRDLPPLEADQSRVTEQNETAAQKLVEKRAHLETLTAVIREVREIDVKIENQRSQVQAVEDAIRETKKQAAASQGHLSELETSLKTEQVALAEIDRYLEQHAADGGLVENMSAIDRLFEALRESNTALVHARKNLKDTAAETQAADKAVAKQETAHRRCRSRRQQAQATHQQLAEVIAGLLAGRELSDWRHELESLKERQGLLEKLKETLQRRAETDSGLKAAETSRRRLEEDLTVLLGEISLRMQEKALREKEVPRLETQVSLLARIRDLEAERRHLEDGRPCPLCGATEHPFAAGNIPVMDDAEAELARIRKELQQVSDELSALQVRQAETRKDIRQAQGQQKSLRAALAADAKECDELFSQLALAADAADSPNTVGSLLENVQQSIAAVSGTLQQIEERTKESEAARKSLDAARQALVGSERALQEARHRQDTARRDYQRLESESASLKRQMESLLREAIETLQAYGVDQVSVSGLDNLLKELKGRRDGWQQRQKARREHEKHLAGLEKESEKQRMLLARLEDELRVRRQEHEQLRRQLEKLDTSRRELFGDKHPGQEEKRLADMVQAAERALERSRRDCTRMAQEVGRLKEKVRLLKASIQKRADVLSEAEQVLVERLKQEGFKDEQDFRKACLSQGKREELLGKEEALHREEAELRSLLQDKGATLEAERMKKITQESIEDLTHKLQAAETARQKAQQEIGAFKERLAENRKQQARRKKNLKQLEIQRKECAHWDVLHGLIGSADGKKYRNFAQGLTFEIMIAHANRQLTGMTDRYLLIRDEAQPLELNVIDNYQAGEIRSTKNLSGGESFIVSLALALGLSQMASRNVRVDSLFLDEGFGTLDEDALETALETLAGLQQEGKLIGVISHVPALKERIATQIQVIREAGGRSRIVGPGCRRMNGTAGLI